MLKICPVTNAKTIWSGSLASSSLACLGCPRAAMTGCGRQSYRKMPISLSCPTSNGKKRRMYRVLLKIHKICSCGNSDVLRNATLYARPHCILCSERAHEDSLRCVISPLSWSACKTAIKESCDTYPRHSPVAKLREKDVPNIYSDL